VGKVAADIHRLDTGPRGSIDGFATRRQHAEDALSVFEGLLPVDPLVADAQAWANEHLPPPAGARLLHGDLLGQNLLLPLEAHEPVGVIDWELALTGDPAYDLAIVTRGLRRPFQRADGFQRLLDTYRGADGTDVAAADVSFYAICLVAEWYREPLDPATRSHPPEQELTRLRGVLRRAIARG
jgi:aminoglycoside phosphotransferase (APT) family kinase protein